MTRPKPFRAVAVLVVAACSLYVRTAVAQPSEQPIVVATREQVHSNVLQEDRVVEIAVPPSYAAGTSRYPVLYLLDGEVNLEHSVGVTRFLAYAARVPELIIVSVHSIDRPDRCCRFRDFTSVPSPTFRINGRPSAEMEPTAGGADAFLRFLTEELIPHVDAQYRTAPFRVSLGTH